MQSPDGSYVPFQFEYIASFIYVHTYLGHRAMYPVCLYTLCNFLYDFLNHFQFGGDGDEMFLEIHRLG